LVNYLRKAFCLTAHAILRHLLFSGGKERMGWTCYLVCFTFRHYFLFNIISSILVSTSGTTKTYINLTIQKNRGWVCRKICVSRFSGDGCKCFAVYVGYVNLWRRLTITYHVHSLSHTQFLSQPNISPIPIAFISVICW
jgi:hypothetical protein